MKHISVILGEFHKKEMEQMLSVVKSKAKELHLKIISEIWVPGSLEKPLAVKRELLKEHVDGVVVLGIIERGETKHGLVMGEAVIKSIIELQLETLKPVGVGILGPEILPEQIEPRLKSYAEAAVKAVAKMLD